MKDILFLVSFNWQKVKDILFLVLFIGRGWMISYFWYSLLVEGGGYPIFCIVYWKRVKDILFL